MGQLGAAFALTAPSTVAPDKAFLLREPAEPPLSVDHRAGPGPCVLYVRGSTFPRSLSMNHLVGGKSWADDFHARGFDVWAFDFACAAALRAQEPDAVVALSGRHATLERAKQHVYAHYRDPLSLSGVAAAVGVTPVYLTQLFKSSTGKPFHQYLLALRLNQALTELPAIRSLTALALDLGFSSHSHFTTLFRSRYGLTPSRARRTYPRQITRIVRYIRAETGNRRVSIMAHSWGTIPAVLFAQAHPDWVEKMVLFNPIFDDTWRDKFAYDPATGRRNADLHCARRRRSNSPKCGRRLSGEMHEERRGRSAARQHSPGRSSWGVVRPGRAVSFKPPSMSSNASG